MRERVMWFAVLQVLDGGISTVARLYWPNDFVEMNPLYGWLAPLPAAALKLALSVAVACVLIRLSRRSLELAKTATDIINGATIMACLIPILHIARG